MDELGLIFIKDFVRNPMFSNTKIKNKKMCHTQVKLYNLKTG